MTHLIGLSRVAVFGVFFSVVGVTSTAHADTTINSQAEAHAFAAGVGSPNIGGVRHVRAGHTGMRWDRCRRGALLYVLRRHSELDHGVVRPQEERT